MKIKKALILGLIGVYTSLFSAQVPEGVKLASEQTLRIDLGAKPENVHPHYSNNFYENWVVRDLFEGLVALDAKGKHTAGGAVRWEANADCTVWTFYLRPTARWSNGDPVTAEDFVYGIRTFILSDSLSSSYVDSLWKIQNTAAVKKGSLPVEALGIQALDTHTLQISLQAPDSCFPERCGLVIFPIHKLSAAAWPVPNDICEPKIQVTNGPFCNLVYYTNLKYRAERNPYYWDCKNTIIENVEYYFTEDIGIRHERFLQGQMDIADLVGYASGFTKQYNEKFGDHFKQLESAFEISVFLNTNRKPLNDINVRQALNMVIDREALLKYLKEPRALPIYSKLHPRAVSQPLIEPEWASWSYQERVTKARAKIKGISIPTLTLMCSPGAAKSKLPVYLAKVWEETLGVNVEVLEMDFQTILQKERNKDFIMALNGNVYVNYSFPWTFLADLVQSSSEKACGYLEPSLTPAQRETAVIKANYLLTIDSPVFSLFYRTSDYLVQTYVGGINNHNLAGCFRAKDLYLVDKA